MQKLVGRVREIKTLNELYGSKKSEFLALYGRRRVGKTYLVNQLFRSKYAFQLTGLSDSGLDLQLKNFQAALARFDEDYLGKPPPTSWFDAFQSLISSLEKKKGRKVIFIDELPWLDTPRSNFLPALEHFWNAWAALRDDVFLIVCGSATSWMIQQLINHRGGLHNRVTARLHLQAFKLRETAEFLRYKNANYDLYQLLQLYMAIGGIPYYLEQLRAEESVAQNIDRLFFSDQGILRSEFYNLYRSLFGSFERHLDIIKLLASKKSGFFRKEISAKSELSNGGSLTRTLQELEQCGFIRSYLPFGVKKSPKIFRLTDFYTLFYLRFVADSRAKGPGSWLVQIDSSAYRSWCGLAFENVCWYHTDEIKEALGISGVYTEISTWRSRDKNNSAQIDLLIDRRDRIINLCEIKYAEDAYTITKDYAEKLKNKERAFKAVTKTKRTTALTFISTYGLKPNAYQRDLVRTSLSAQQIFKLE